MSEQESKEAIVHLWIGGMESLDRETAIKMYFEGEDKEYFPERNPKMLYAVGIPIIWFWRAIQDQDDEEPVLHDAFSRSYFTIHYTYPLSEFVKLVKSV